MTWTEQSKKSMLNLIVILGSLVLCGIVTSFALLYVGEEKSLIDGTDCEGMTTEETMEVII